MVAENIASAGIHGIYAGDIDKLSVQSIMPTLTSMEGEYGSVLRGTWHLFWNRMRYMPVSQLETESSLKEVSWGWNALAPVLRRASTFTLKGGLEKFPRALANRLAENPNVSIQRKTTVTKIMPSQTDQQVTRSSITVPYHLFASSPFPFLFLLRLV